MPDFSGEQVTSGTDVTQGLVFIDPDGNDTPTFAAGVHYNGALGFDPSITVDNNDEALQHYNSNAGTPVELGDEIKSILRNSDRMKLAIENLESGNTNQHGSFGVNLAPNGLFDYWDDEFFIGDTTVHYTTEIKGNATTTTFTGFVETVNNQIVGVDGFRDPTDLGVEPYTPYLFVPHVWTHTYETPEEWM